MKDFYKSKTVGFFVLVLATGGLDLIQQFVEQEQIGWRSVALLVIGLAGIGLRLVTSQPVKVK